MIDRQRPDKKALEPDKEIHKTQSELDRLANSPQRDKNKQGGQHGAGQGIRGVEACSDRHVPEFEQPT